LKKTCVDWLASTSKGWRVKSSVFVGVCVVENACSVPAAVAVICGISAPARAPEPATISCKAELGVLRLSAFSLPDRSYPPEAMPAKEMKAIRVQIKARFITILHLVFNLYSCNMFAYQMISFMLNYSPYPCHTGDPWPIYSSVVLSDPFHVNTLVKALLAAENLALILPLLTFIGYFLPR
jgi:hypothetical protein